MKFKVVGKGQSGGGCHIKDLRPSNLRLLTLVTALWHVRIMFYIHVTRWKTISGSHLKLAPNLESVFGSEWRSYSGGAVSM